MRDELNRRVRLPMHVREQMAERAWAARRRGELPEEEVDAANEVELLIDLAAADVAQKKRRTVLR